jgi:aspartate aminotransferase
MQKVIAENQNAVADLETYKLNRDLLYNALTEYGYDCIRPDGAFYLFVKSPEADAKEFCKKAMALDLLLVPSDSFGCEGYIRISYCVSTDMIKRSLPLFKKLMDENY